MYYSQLLEGRSSPTSKVTVIMPPPTPASPSLADVAMGAMMTELSSYIW